MKNQIQSLVVGLVVFSGLQQVNAAITFTITPNVISNTYNGVVTLQVSGITAGDTVVVQKFLDTDSNSVLDASAILWQQFQITDGEAAVFKNGATSVTNFNVAGDTDGSANGAITANLYPAMDFAQTVVGKYFFKLSSPVGHFSAITNSFNVTNFPFAQSFSGSVVNNGTNVPDAVIVLFQPNSQGNQNPQGGVLANGSGGYKIAAAPGNYELAAIKTNFVANLDATPNVTLSSGAAIVTNVPLVNATRGVSGRVVDANNSSIGLGGYLLPIETKDHLLAVAFTDTNGNFSAGVTSNQWEIGQDRQSLLVIGYLALQSGLNVDTTTGSVSGITIALPKESAVFYGTVKTSTGAPLPGAEVSSDDNNNNVYEGAGIVFTNGNYVTSAIGNGDPWSAHYDEYGPANYIYSQPAFDQNGGTNISAGQAVPVNITGLSAANTVTGNIQDSAGNPVAGLGVNFNATINSLVYNAHTDTDTNGNYSLNLANGDWDVSVNSNDGGDGLQDIYTNGNFEPPPDVNTNINSANASINFLVQLTGGDIFGQIVDTYGNSVVGVDVNANDGVGDNYTGTTDASGHYRILVGDGSWDVSVDCGELNALGYQCVADDSVTISDANSEANFEAQFSTPPMTPVFSFETIYGFSALTENATNGDGAGPNSGVVLSGGNLYGTTYSGGTNDNGTIFEVGTNLSNFVDIHAFAASTVDARGNYTNTDGVNTYAGLVQVSNVFYGVATYGGLDGNGTVFKLNANGAGFSVLHSFSGDNNTNADGFDTNSDGANPYGSLVASGGILYGTTAFGGTNGGGTIFAIDTNGTGFKILHAFTAYNTVTGDNADGADPYAGLLLYSNTLYGIALYGGAYGDGAVFKVGTNGSGFFTVYNFTGGDDGRFPQFGGLIASGNNLFGTAPYGGEWGEGNVFALNTNGTTFSVLHSFTGQNDGSTPYGGLTLSSNILYGTASSGGSGGGGIVFAINTNTLNLTVLHSFSGDTDGADPMGGVLLSQNTLYGTAASGGPYGNGAVFAVALTPLPTLSSGVFSNGYFQMAVSGSANQTYTVQMSTNVLSPNWISLLVTNPPSASFMFTDPEATNRQRFYRVKVGQ